MKKILIAALIIFALILLSFCGDDDSGTQNEDVTQDLVIAELQDPTNSTAGVVSENITEETEQDAVAVITESETEQPAETTTAPPVETTTEPPAETTAERPAEPETEDDYETVQETTKKEVMVWIPTSGSKYHSSSGCSNMKNPSQVTLEKAQSWGYSACQKCY